VQNLSEGIAVSAVYGRGEGAWLKRSKKKFLIKRDKAKQTTGMFVSIN
jgi:hypothetical protein